VETLERHSGRKAAEEEERGKLSFHICGHAAESLPSAGTALKGRSWKERKVARRYIDQAANPDIGPKPKAQNMKTRGSGWEAPRIRWTPIPEKKYEQAAREGACGLFTKNFDVLGISGAELDKGRKDRLYGGEQGRAERGLSNTVVCLATWNSLSDAHRREKKTRQKVKVLPRALNSPSKIS